jgi:CMP-N,N'-diacetyllegionaminic acid synthase
VNVLGLIPARGGSKGIPRKNIARCGGKPLIAWTCAAARDARCLSRVIVSTDDPEIAAVASAEGIPAPFLRPADLATDTARSIDVAIHALEWLETHAQWRTDVLVLLQPTTPLRTAQHIDGAFTQLTPDLDSVCSVIEVPARFKPWKQLELECGVLKELQPHVLSFDRHRRQGQPVLYTRSGPAVIATHARVIRAGSFYGERMAAYVMNARDSLDIDDAHELEIADLLLRSS